jgi:hypothetical protein
VKHRPGHLKRQRERIAAALRADASRSSNSIAVEIGCSSHTVKRVRGHMQERTQGRAENGTHPGSENLLPREPGNDRAVTHGAHSEARIAPLRAVHLAALRDQFTAVDERLLSVQAERMAQYQLLTAWLDANGLVKDGASVTTRGQVYSAATFAETLARSFEKQFDRLREIQAEADAVDPAVAMESVVAEIFAARENGEPDG